jgi:hypothetical protein
MVIASVRSEIAQRVQLCGTYPFAQARIGHPESFFGSQAEHSDLPRVPVLLDQARRLANLFERIDSGKDRGESTQCEEAAAFGLFLQIRRVAPENALRVHPQIPVVVLVLVSGA